MKVLNNTLIATAVAGLLAGAATQASAEEITEVFAQPAGEIVQVTVSYGDLDLSSAKGQDTLYYRLAGAAEEVCGSSSFRDVASVAQANRNKACQKDSLNSALSRVNSAVASIN